jgi:hypothetical protein
MSAKCHKQTYLRSLSPDLTKPEAPRLYLLDLGDLALRLRSPFFRAAPAGVCADSVIVTTSPLSRRSLFEMQFQPLSNDLSRNRPA